jgi:hypothetical protein
MLLRQVKPQAGHYVLVESADLMDDLRVEGSR